MPSRLRSHAPAGEPVSLAALMGGPPSDTRRLSGWMGFGSGTEALAAVVSYCRQSLPEDSSIALPGYSCPSLIAAAHFAGIDVRLVDLAANQLSPGSEELNSALDAGARVLVLVDLFGVQAPLRVAMALARTRDAIVIHDRAQSLAGPGLAQDSPADFVVVSLGRGKPATLLGGGAAWARDNAAFCAYAEQQWPLASWNRLATLLRSSAYNLAVKPGLYGCVASIPGLRLGETRLVPLAKIRRMPSQWSDAAARQIVVRQREVAARLARTSYLEEQLRKLGYRMFDDVTSGQSSDGLNRLPVLCSTSEQAEFLVQRGRKYGISHMYGRTLGEFIGRSPAWSAEHTPNAYAVSRRLVTLPTHSRLDDRDLSALLQVLSDAS